MANDHAHGAFGYVELEKVDNSFLDLTPYLTGFNAPKSTDVAEDTNMDPAGGFKTYLLGLSGMTVDLSLEPGEDGTPLIEFEAIRAARVERTIRIFPFGKVVGKYYEEAQVLFTNPGSLSGGLTGPVTASAAMQVTGEPTKDVWAG